MRSKIAIIGTGRVGSTAAYTIILKNLSSELVLIDSNTDRCEGEVRDISDALAFSEAAHIRQGTYADAQNADIIVITAGHAQQGPHETRRDLAQKNKSIIKSIFQELNPISKSAIIIIVTNPVDLMALTALQCCGLDPQKVFGTGTWLDTQRLRRHVGTELGVSPQSLDAFVLGEHGDAQFVPWTHAHVGGQPLASTGLSPETLKKLAQATAHEVYTIIEKKCATYYGIAACIGDIIETIIFDQKKIMPVSCFNPDLGICISTPVVLGAQGIERTMLIPLSDEEKKIIRSSAAVLADLYQEN